MKRTMTKSVGGRPKQTKGDPFVTMDAARLATALRAEGLSIKQASDALRSLGLARVSHAVIGDLVTGKQKRTRASIRDALTILLIGTANASEWLGGADEPLTYPAPGLAGFGAAGFTPSMSSQITFGPGSVSLHRGTPADLLRLRLAIDLLRIIPTTEPGSKEQTHIVLVAFGAVWSATDLTSWRAEHGFPVPGEQEQLAFATNMVVAVRLLVKPYLDAGQPMTTEAFDALQRSLGRFAHPDVINEQEEGEGT